jgi:hypothetical protein
MHLALILLADYAAADAAGKLNILGAFTNLYAFQFPVKHPLMYLVMKFQPAPGEYGDSRTLRIVLIDQDGGELHAIAHNIEIPRIKHGQLPEINAIISFRDLEFIRPGHYEFRVFIDKEQKGEAPLVVTHLKPLQPEE